MHKQRHLLASPDLNVDQVIRNTTVRRNEHDSKPTASLVPRGNRPYILLCLALPYSSEIARFLCRKEVGEIFGCWVGLVRFNGLGHRS